jgi:hypothetical protein
MPHYSIQRQGYQLVIDGYRIVVSGVCEKVSHEVRFNTDLTPVGLQARNQIISEFVARMRGKEYTPDGPTVYCVDCQEHCQHKGMEG